VTGSTRWNLMGVGGWGYGVLPHFQNYYILAKSFIDGGNRSARGQPPICRKSLTNFIT